jgi:hypothetical protein
MMGKVRIGKVKMKNKKVEAGCGGEVVDANPKTRVVIVR